MKTNKKLTSLKALILTNVHEWMVMNSDKIDILIDNKIYQNEFLKDYETSTRMVILNISPVATGNFSISDEGVSFSATFNSILRSFKIPLIAVIAIKLKEDLKGDFPWYTLPTQSNFNYGNTVNIDLMPSTTTLTVTDGPQVTLMNGIIKKIKVPKENKNNVVNIFSKGKDNE